jgi:hypothetical protein
VKQLAAAFSADRRCAVGLNKAAWAAEASTREIGMLEPDKLKAAGEAMKDGTAKAAENSAALSMKVIDHAEENTRQAFAALRAAAKAGGITDLMKVQADFVRDQGTRSMAQVREIGEMIASFGREAMSGLSGKKDDPSA